MIRRATALILALGSLSAALYADENRGFRGLFAVRGDRILGSEDADRLFVPASVQKLVIAAAALHHLGPDHRIATVLRGSGELRDGVLAGDLIVEAAGDPTWSERFFANDPPPLETLVQQLVERGVRRIGGDLVIDVTSFPGRSFPTSRPASEYAYGYAAPTSALAVDENAVKIEIAPGSRVGAPATVELRSASRGSSTRLVNHIVTVSRERHGVGTVDFLPVWESGTLVARGEYPISEPPYSIEISVPAPEQHAAGRLLEVLKRRGIAVGGEVRLESLRPGQATATILARVESPALTTRLEPILTDSHNWHAEMLLRVLAAEVSGEGRLDEGLEIERRFLVEVVGCAEDSFELDDASGLLPYNLITPRTVVELLRFVRRQPWHASFLAAMARNGTGTLEVWSGLPPVTAKTGTVRHSLGLAGYLDPSDPEPIVFACFLNHRPGERSLLRAEIAALLRSWRVGP